MKLNIVIVDDEAPIRDWLKYRVRKLGEPYEVIGVCKSAQEAETVINSGEVDVLITDIEMPGMTGLELMSRIKNKYPTISFVVLTSHADFSYAKEAITLGTVEYLLKSELRAEELAYLLNKLFKEKEASEKDKLWSSNRQSFDVSLLKSSSESPSEYNSYLSKMGVLDAAYCCVLSVINSSDLNIGNKVRDYTERVNYDVIFYSAANEYDYILFFGQAKSKISGHMEYWLSDELVNENVGVGVSELGSDMQMIPEYIKQSEISAKIYFYSSKYTIYHYKQIEKNSLLPRNEIWRLYKETLFSLKTQKYELVKDYLDEWQSIFGFPNPMDVLWGIEMSIKMVLAFEEHYYSQREKTLENMVNINNILTLNDCISLCAIMLEKIDDADKHNYSKRIEEALIFIHDNYNKDISMVEVARKMHLTPEYFSRLFKAEVKDSFSTYLIMYRLNKAEFLLANTDMTISEIAYEIGYSAPGNFSRVYKKYKGISPAAARSNDL
ncbi:response regulator transcription factor [Vallitalea sp.]|jgi:YesN/AraC family two-component response regulator|uniref:response regulator transcription factor n=1 Tax=Vallitalea sp. TaxID=1882829 RepID=UPI0025E1D2FF|nr:response regulator [Vallitalea sp.]MCT4686138.1 response regulator [Vallitalea sp.]